MHSLDQGNDVVLLDVEVLDGALEEFFFCRHGLSRISTFEAGLARVLCKFCATASDEALWVQAQIEVVVDWHLSLVPRLPVLVNVFQQQVPMPTRSLWRKTIA